MTGDDQREPPDRGLRMPGRDRAAAAGRRACAWPGCDCEALYRAPRARDRLRDFVWFCLDHIRAYNQSWDYFAGMDIEAIEAHRRADATWHRPTWRMGAGWQPDPRRWHDPFDFAEGLYRERGPAEPPPPPQDEREVASLECLGLRPGYSTEELRARYKLLVKRYHPDLRGGDTAAEAMLRAVIEAYRYLRDHRREPA